MPFKPGDPNINREGRPVGSLSITSEIKKKLMQVEPKTKKTWLELTITRILLKANNEGDTQMLKAIWSYIDGMPTQNIEASGSIELSFHESLKANETRTLSTPSQPDQDPSE